MAVSSDDDDALSDSTMTTLDVLAMIQKTWLGKEVRTGVLYSTEEALFGDEAALLRDDLNGHRDGWGQWHDDDCPCSETNGLYDWVRDRPCICNAPNEGEEELLAVLPPDHFVVIAALVDYGSRALEHQTTELRLGQVDSPIWRFLSLSQKLDDAVIAICKSLVQAAKTDERAVHRVVQAFDAIQKARNALKAPYRDFRHVYFFHSLAHMAKCHTQETSYVVQKILRRHGRLPEELVELTRDFYIEAAAKDVDLDERAAKYFDTYCDCNNFDED